MGFLKKNKFTANADLSDDELIVLFKSTHNNEYIGDLFNRYIHLVYGISIKYLKDKEESKDAVMQIFEKLLSDLKKYEVASFKHWLFMVTKNYCLLQIQHKSSFINKQKEYYKSQDIYEEPDTLEKFEVKENQLKGLDVVLPLLKGEQKVCIDLFYFQEKSYNEISDHTGYSVSQVKSYIQNGKRNLKILLLQHNESIFQK